MAVQTISTNTFPKQSSSEIKGPWAILEVLSLIKDTLTKGQQKISEATQRLIENNSKTQDKRSKELKQLVKLSLEALEKETQSNVIRDISIGFIIAAIVGGPIVASLAAKNAVYLGIAAQFLKPVCVILGSILGIKAETMTIETANKQFEIAEIDKHNNVDAALTRSNVNSVAFSGDTLRAAAEAKAKLQQAVTEIIISTGSSLKESIR